MRKLTHHMKGNHALFNALPSELPALNSHRGRRTIFLHAYQLGTEGWPTTPRVSFRSMSDQSSHATMAKGAPALARMRDTVTAVAMATRTASRVHHRRRRRESSTPVKAPGRTNHVRDNRRDFVSSRRRIINIMFIFHLNPKGSIIGLQSSTPKQRHGFNVQLVLAAFDVRNAAVPVA